MPTATNQSTWDARIARARELASSRPAARDLLTFYAALAAYQRTLAAGAREAAAFDLDVVIESIPGFLEWLRQNGRSDLAAATEIDSVASAFMPKSNDSRSLPAEAGSHPSVVGVASAFRRKAAAAAILLSTRAPRAAFRFKPGTHTQRFIGRQAAAGR
jgi:hypothetical protein